MDFDATLFVSSVAAAYPELYKSCLDNWTNHSLDRDLIGDVNPLVTGVMLSSPLGFYRNSLQLYAKLMGVNLNKWLILRRKKVTNSNISSTWGLGK